MAAKPTIERLQKVLAGAGLGSRREIEGWIRAGRVKVNGKIACLGVRVRTSDRIRVDDRDVDVLKKSATRTKILAYYKPVGEVCSRRDEKGRRTVFQSLPRLKSGRWINIGRLDITTSGLLLFTNDGDLANKLMHPSSNIDREYAVRILGKASSEQLKALRKGVQLEDGPARFTDIVYSGGEGQNHWYHVVIMAGRNREVRRLWESQGFKVSRLIRVRFGPYILSRTNKTGQFWDLTEEQITALKNYGVSIQKRSFSSPPRGED